MATAILYLLELVKNAQYLLRESRRFLYDGGGAAGSHFDAVGERLSTLQCAASRRELVFPRDELWYVSASVELSFHEVPRYERKAWLPIEIYLVNQSRLLTSLTPLTALSLFLEYVHTLIILIPKLIPFYSKEKTLKSDVLLSVAPPQLLIHGSNK